MIDVVETVEAFESLKSEWERLEQNPAMRIYQTYAWCKHAWDCYVSKEKGARLWILRWCQNGRKDTVIFPFYIDGKHTLRFIMDRRSDLCNVVYDEVPDRHWTYKEVVAKILENKTIKAINLQKMSAESEAFRYLAILLPESLIYKDNAYSWLNCEKCEDFIANQRQMRSKDRADLKAILRKSNKYELKVLSAQNKDAFPYEQIAHLKSQMVGIKRRTDFVFPETLQDFIFRIYMEGNVNILLLEKEGEAVALNFLLKKGNYYVSWVFLYSDPHASTTMYIKYLTNRVHESAFTFDFGVGVYSYKIGTFRPCVSPTFALRYGLSWRHYLISAYEMNLRYLKNYLKTKLKRH